MCFYANLDRHFLKLSNVGRYIYPDFQGFCPDFQQIKTLGDVFALPAPPPPTTLLSNYNSITVNFMVYQDRLQTNLLQRFGYPENSE